MASGKEEGAVVKIYTDGSCIGNPGPGGWACIFIFSENVTREKIKQEKIFKKISGLELNTTNNRMEMSAILNALEFMQKNLKFFKDKNVECFSDSNLVVQTLMQGWKKKANLDLWQAIDQAQRGLKISYRWVKGHSTDEYNNACDQIAQTEARKALKLLSTKKNKDNKKIVALPKSSQKSATKTLQQKLFS